MEYLISPCAQLLTLAGTAGARRGKGQTDLGLVEDGAVWMVDGRIQMAGHRDNVEQAVGSRRISRISAEDCVVMPGFVDCHSHPVFMESRIRDFEQRIMGRTYQEIAARGGGILSTVQKVRTATQEELIRKSLPRLWSFLKHGTTTLEAKSGYGLNMEAELKMLEAIQKLNALTPLELVPTFLGAHEIPSEYRDNPGAYLGEILNSILPEVARRRLAEYCDGFIEPDIFGLAAAETLFSEARKHGLKPRLHADQLSRSGATRLGVRMGAVSVDHLDRIEDEEIELLARHATIAVLLPGSVYYLGSDRYPPARRLIEAGAPVALATDFNPGSSPVLNMQMILSLACTQMRMTPAEAIVAATINGAYALDRGGRCGSLEAGKQADVCIMDAPDYREIPYYFGVNHCKMVFKNGKPVQVEDALKAQMPSTGFQAGEVLS
ncbi:MAG TPA: imidazolonepropionase [Acidobacteriota bacterium]|nr:imidazolonepropionase [Acidobacteriota bacterium]